MIPISIILLIVYILLSVAVSTALILYDYLYDGEATEILPQELHYNTDMNWVGCIVVSILLLLLLPLIWIYRLFYMLFHL